MKFAVLGGSFNPIHLGHLYLADMVLSSLPVDRVILVPANISPFKQHQISQHLISGQDRLDMILASIAADPRITADDLELRRGGVSYTIDTLNEIIDRYRPEGKPFLILGDDLLADFPKWKAAEEITQKAELVAARRLSRPEEFSYPFRVLQNEVMEISSALVRERIGRGGPWRSLVPPGARFIIEDRGLYAAPAAGGLHSLTALVEDAARAALSPGRFLHSRNTALLARDLAQSCGLSGEAAYLAGIAHDMAKGLGKKEMIALAKEDGERLNALEKKKPSMLHGRAAAVLLRERFGIHNEDILEAAAVHTAGKTGMGPLAKAVFIADKIELSRKDVERELREWAAEIAGKTGSSGSGNGTAPARLEMLFRAVLEDNVRWLKEQGLEVAKETIRLTEIFGTTEPKEPE